MAMASRSHAAGLRFLLLLAVGCAASTEQGTCEDGTCATADPPMVKASVRSGGTSGWGLLQVKQERMDTTEVYDDMEESVDLAGDDNDNDDNDNNDPHNDDNDNNDGDNEATRGEENNQGEATTEGEENNKDEDNNEDNNEDNKDNNDDDNDNSDNGNGHNSTDALAPASSSFTYFRFTPTANRRNKPACRDNHCVQIADFFLFNQGQRVPLNGAKASADGGRSPGREGPDKAIDGNFGTKWLDFGPKQKGALPAGKFPGTPYVIKMPKYSAVDAFTMRTANDAPDRDPVKWKWEGSKDGQKWNLIYEQKESAKAPVQRFTLYPLFKFDGSVEATVPGMTQTATTQAPESRDRRRRLR